MFITDRKILSNSIPPRDLPKVFIEPSTMAQVEYIVDSVSTTEVAFYLFLKKLESGDLLIFGDCFIPKQEVSGGTAKTDDLGEAIMTDLIIDLAEADKTGNTPSDRDLLVHCHSHVLMDCKPSIQDGKNLDLRYADFKDSPNPPEFALQIIFNQKREHYCQVIKMDTPLHEVYSCKIGLYKGIQEETFKRINSEIKNNITDVTKKTTPSKDTLPSTTKVTDFSIYKTRTQVVNTFNSIELWSEYPLQVLGELNKRQKQIFGVIVKDMIFSATSEKQAYERLTTIINSITKMKDNPNTLIYSFNDETLGYTVFVSYSEKNVALVNTKTGKVIFGEGNYE